jgi:DNA-binding transcriptional LysR family regulator
MVASTQHPWATRKKLTVDDLTAGKWVLREDGSGTRAAFVKALGTLGVRYENLNIAIELPSNEAVLSAVLAGAGATILSVRVCADAVKAGALRRLPVTIPPRGFLRSSACRPLSLSRGFGTPGNPSEAFRSVIFHRAGQVDVLPK